jgi:hypothetical protein
VAAARLIVLILSAVPRLVVRHLKSDGPRTATRCGGLQLHGRDALRVDALLLAFMPSTFFEMRSFHHVAVSVVAPLANVALALRAQIRLVGEVGGLVGRLVREEHIGVLALRHVVGDLRDAVPAPRRPCRAPISSARRRRARASRPSRRARREAPARFPAAASSWERSPFIPRPCRVGWRVEYHRDATVPALVRSDVAAERPGDSISARRRRAPRSPHRSRRARCSPTLPSPRSSRSRWRRSPHEIGVGQDVERRALVERDAVRGHRGDLLALHCRARSCAFT